VKFVEGAGRNDEGEARTIGYFMGNKKLEALG
jgi:hypothetical protein